VDITEGYITTEDGVRLFFRKIGNGERTALFPNGVALADDFERLCGNRTVIFYDVRNRGRSDRILDQERRQRGIHHDVEDLDAVRRHFRLDRVDVIGHSYVGVTVVLYAMRYPKSVNRVVQLGAMAPSQAVQYPPHLMNVDSTLREALAGLAALEPERASLEPEEFCRKFWNVLRTIYVANPADADRIHWIRCDLPNERNFMRPWLEDILPSIQKLELTPDDLAQAAAPVLTIHGTRDRSSPYGGARDWALRLPNARLVTVEGAAHGPWIEAPDVVFGSLDTFLDGGWPDWAEKVTPLDPSQAGL